MRGEIMLAIKQESTPKIVLGIAPEIAFEIFPEISPEISREIAS